MNKPAWMDDDDDDDDLDLDDLSDDDLEDDDPAPAAEVNTDGLANTGLISACQHLLRQHGILLPENVRPHRFLMELRDALVRTEPPGACAPVHQLALVRQPGPGSATIRTQMTRAEPVRTLSTAPIFDPAVERRKREERAGDEIAALAGAPPRRAVKPGKRRGGKIVPSTAAQDAGTELASLAGVPPRKPAPPAKSGRTNLFETPAEELVRLANTPDYRQAGVP